jgi:3-methylcrotonyl-CoA carboxylase beta subunit
MASGSRYWTYQLKATKQYVDKQGVHVFLSRKKSTRIAGKDYSDLSHDGGVRNGNSFPNAKPPVLANCEVGDRLKFQESMARNQSLVQKLNERIHAAHRGGGEHAVKRHLSRNKLLPRDRINLICDPGTPFLELSALAGMYSYASKRVESCDDEDVPSGGVVTGIGVIHSMPCMIVANDATVKGG